MQYEYLDAAKDKAPLTRNSYGNLGRSPQPSSSASDIKSTRTVNNAELLNIEWVLLYTSIRFRSFNIPQHRHLVNL